jgi:hypothetical protein
VLRKAVVLAALAALAISPAATASRTIVQLMPRIDHIKDVRHIGGVRVVFHLAVGPRPGGLYDLRPVLSNGQVTGLETLTSMQRRMLPRANVVGVNGDLFSPASGIPTGVFVSHGSLMSTPIRGRSSLGIGADGLLHIARLTFDGTFQIEGGRVRNLREFNRPFGRDDGFALYARSWGPRTPVHRLTHELILKDVGRAIPNRDRAAVIVRRVKGSGHAIPDGGAVLQARGDARRVLSREAAPDLGLTFRLELGNWWADVRDALGGGPLLVKAGVPVYNAREWFTSAHLNLRHPRTAVGQRADGSIILLVADGRSALSRGLTMRQLADAMVSYGAQRAMSLDGGGSSEMAFNGTVFNRPSDGGERSLAESLQLVYIGAYARKPRYEVFSPNGDGYHDRERLYAKFVRRSDVHLQLFRPNGELKWERRDRWDPRVFKKDIGPRLGGQGAWRWVVSGTDLRGRNSRMVRRFRVNNTLGFLDLSTRTMRVRRSRGGRLRIGFRVAQSADVRVVIERGGKVVRHLVSRDGLGAGAYAVIWNGKNDAGSVVRSGRFVAVVRAQNGLGRVDLRKRFAVERVS